MNRFILHSLFLFLFLTQNLFAGIIFNNNQYEVTTTPGVSHSAIIVPYSLSDPGFDDSVVSVSSDSSWVIPSPDPTNDQIQLTFDMSKLIASYTATLTVEDGEKTQELFFSVTVAKLDIWRFINDPVRQLIYGISRNDYDSGCIVCYDMVTETIQKTATVGKGPTDFCISNDNSTLFVLNHISQTISVIDLSTFTVTRTILLPEYTDWGPEDTAGNLKTGPENILYYTDGSWAPILYVFDLETESVVQSTIWQDDSGMGFMDFDLTSDYSKLISLPQFGWSAGVHRATYGMFDVDSAGLITQVKTTTNNGISRDPMEAPVLIDNEDQRAFLKTVSCDPYDTDNRFKGSPSAVWSISPRGELIATSSKILDAETNEPLYELDSVTPVSITNYVQRYAQTFTNDYSKFVYFDAATATIKTVDLVAEIGLERMGQTIFPKDGSVVSSPNQLTWTPILGTSTYDVYLGTDSTEIASANTSSSSYLGRVSATFIDLPNSLAIGTEYYWRVDPVTSVGPTTGIVHKFRVSPISLSQSFIEVATLSVHNDFAVSIGLDSPTPRNWTASAVEPWVNVLTPSGTTSGSLEIRLDASQLTVGLHPSSLTLVCDGDAIEIPIKLEVVSLNITHFTSDRRNAIIYAISEDTTVDARQAFLLKINSEDESIENVVPVTPYVSDLDIHYFEGRVYVAQSESGLLEAYHVDTLAHEEGYPFTPFNFYDLPEDDVYKVACGVDGRIVVEERDQWIDMNIMNTATGDFLSTEFVREGGGAFGPSGRYYYHGENNSSGAELLKYDVAGDEFTLQESTRPSSISSYYGSRTVVVTEDGSRVFWSGVVFDADLNEEWAIGEIIYAASSDGRFAFGNTNIWDVNVRRVVLEMPVSTSVSCYNSTSQKLIVQESGKIRFYGVSSPMVFPTPSLTITKLGETTVELEWDDQSLESNFQIQYREQGTAEWIDAATVDKNTTSTTISNLQEATVYEFRVRATSPEYSSSWSNVETARTFLVVPQAPVLNAPVASNDQVELSWNDGLIEHGYLVERSPNGVDGWTEIGSTAINVTTYIDSGLQELTDYYYRIRAWRGPGFSGYSNVQHAHTPERPLPLAPSTLKVSVSGLSALKLEWSDVDNEDSYLIERKSWDGNSFQILATLSADVVTYTDSDLVTHKSYSYRVLAKNNKGESAYSQIVTGVPGSVAVLLEDDFDTDIDDLMWDEVLGASAIEQAIGFLGSNALYFSGGAPRRAVTKAFDATNADEISFKIRGGNESESSSIWNNSEIGEHVTLEYSMDEGVSWITIQTLNTVYPSLSSWEAFTIDFPKEAKNENLQLRWIQYQFSGSSYDVWALEDVQITGSIVPPDAPSFLITEVVSSDQIDVRWSSVKNADGYQIERMSLGGTWDIISTWTNLDNLIYPDTGLLPGKFYQYRVHSINDNGISPYTTGRMAKTWSAFDQWQIDEFGTIDVNPTTASTGSGFDTFIQYAFNITSPGDSQTMEAYGTSGLPRHFTDGSFLCVEFVRRRHQGCSGINYFVEFSDDMITWVDSGQEIDVQVIDTFWERVIIKDTIPFTPENSRFSRVSIRLF